MHPFRERVYLNLVKAQEGLKEREQIGYVKKRNDIKTLP